MNKLEKTTEVAAEKTARLIKKYQNRKLYDTESSCYVILEDIAKMIKRGEDIKVVENNSGKEITAVILTEILYDQEKNKKSILPLTMLKNLIASGSGSIYEFMQKYVFTSFNSIQNLKTDTERYIDRLIQKGELSKNEGRGLLKELTTTAEKGFDEIQTKIDERIKSTISKVKSITDIQGTITTLQTKIEGLEKKLKSYSA
jgi:polyhydroxyalkanoate synthesis repressor PhaR